MSNKSYAEAVKNQDCSVIKNNFRSDAVAPELPVTITTVREREKKWIRMLTKWSKYSSPNDKKHNQIMKTRARKGIPDSMRGRAWMFLRYFSALRR